jgi:magnesium transporter
VNSILGKRHLANLRMGRRTSPGHIPGSLVADPEAAAPRIHLLGFDANRCEQLSAVKLTEISAFRARHDVTWIDVRGLGNVATIRRIGESLGLHPLAIEDVVNTHQRAKVEAYEDHLFVVARVLVPGERAATEQLSIFLGKDFLLTFQERQDDCLEPVRDRICEGKGRIRSYGPDYLMHALLDTVVDAYFPELERIGEELEQLDEEIDRRLDRSSLQRIHVLKNDLLTLRRAIWPFREDIGRLAREPHPLIEDETRIFLRDCYDHSLQIVDLVETCREICADLRDFYLSALNNRMSEVMKVLTIIATIFIPLSFVAGVYGMNFDREASNWNMPELGWALGYPAILVLMGGMALGQLWYFWQRGWLRRF